MDLHREIDRSVLHDPTFDQAAIRFGVSVDQRDRLRVGRPMLEIGHVDDHAGALCQEASDFLFGIEMADIALRSVAEMGREGEGGRRDRKSVV